MMPLDTTRQEQKKAPKCSAKFSEKDFIAASDLLRGREGLEAKHRESR
jgi:hypothetical protein